MKSRFGGPAFVLALIALFVALSGGAVAAGIVPVAKHAFTADTASNALKLGGKTPAQLSKTFRGARGPQGAPGPAGPQGDAGAKGPQGPQGASGPQGATGPQGAKGDVGAGLKIVGTVPAAADLPATGATGDAYLVTGNLYVWTGSAWTNAGPVQGPKGDTGAQGAKGDTGAQGVKGDPGTPGTAAVTIHTTTFALTAVGTANDQGVFTATCGSGQKAVSGGFESPGSVFNYDTRPTDADDGWQIYLVNRDDTGNTGTLYAVCLG